MWSPNVFNTEEDGRPAYATCDLLQEHPMDRNRFKVYGRADDQIILSTGEKVNVALRVLSADVLIHPSWLGHRLDESCTHG